MLNITGVKLALYFLFPSAFLFFLHGRIHCHTHTKSRIASRNEAIFLYYNCAITHKRATARGSPLHPDTIRRNLKPVVARTDFYPQPASRCIIVAL